jgi:iodotyrosine deiodinase
MMQWSMAIHEPLRGYPDLDDAARLARVLAFEDSMRPRRTVRQFAATPVAREVIESAIRTASRAPSGANLQPWTFVAVSDPHVRRRIREAAEEEERSFYGGRAPQAWLDALQPFGTDAHKPFLETAPWLIAVFGQAHGLHGDGSPVKHYYVKESVGIATGFLLAALHQAGLATLTHTPSPMGFLREVLGRPANEQAFVLVVTGLPAAGATVPVIAKKPLAEIARFVVEEGVPPRDVG